MMLSSVCYCCSNIYLPFQFFFASLTASMSFVLEFQDNVVFCLFIDVNHFGSCIMFDFDKILQISIFVFTHNS